MEQKYHILGAEAKDDKPKEAFRDYTVDDNDPIKMRVRRTYYEMHTKMTVDFVKGKYFYHFSFVDWEDVVCAS